MLRKNCVNHMTKKMTKLLFLFSIGGALYYCIELLFRGFSHSSMFVLGGLCFVICGGFNEVFGDDISIISQMLLSMVVITTLELIFGYILNIRLHMNIWDYSDQIGNFKGQICLLFSLMWFFLSGAAIIVDDYLRYWLYDEDKPEYVFFRKHGQKK